MNEEDELDRAAAAARFKGSFEKFTLKDGMLRRGMLSAWPVSECAAVVDTGVNIQKMSAGRVILGSVLLGPLGTVIGALAKKNKTKVYLAITVPGDAFLMELGVKDEGKARAFAQQVNEAAAAT